MEFSDYLFSFARFNRVHGKEGAIKFSWLLASKYLLLNRDAGQVVEDQSFGFLSAASENVLERGISNMARLA